MGAYCVHTIKSKQRFAGFFKRGVLVIGEEVQFAASPRPSPALGSSPTCGAFFVLPVYVWHSEMIPNITIFMVQ